jgi:prepilin-type N-terminal cleavage/methylation domain-containing protein
MTRITQHGFTILELMVGVFILTIGILGFSGMVMMQAQGTRIAKGLDEAATLVQSQVETLDNVTWADLGNQSAGSCITGCNGFTNGDVWTEGPLNRNGESTCSPSTGNPCSYYRSTVICTENTKSVKPGNNPLYCGSTLSGDNRPQALACEKDDTLAEAMREDPNSREKIIRVLVAWTDRNGKCHYKRTDAVAFQWSPAAP